MKFNLVTQLIDLTIYRLIVEISIPFDYTVLNITSFALSSVTTKTSLMPADGMPMSAKRLFFTKCRKPGSIGIFHYNPFEMRLSVELACALSQCF